MNSDNFAIYVDNLSYRYPDGRQALDSVHLQVEHSSRLVLAGPNGCGKSTLLLHLNGLLDGPGEISIAGLPRTRKNMGSIRKRIGYLFSQVEYQFIMPDLLNDVMLSVPDVIADLEHRKHIAMGWIKKLGLEDYANRSPLDLSSGEMKRAALAGILAREPEVILMDEPLGNLDRKSSMMLIDILSSLKQTMLIATHREIIARECATHIAFMREGRVTGTYDAGKALFSKEAKEVLF
ncbi:MAG: energy-coupling factor ABC transporter ATP-binding protein [Spirochaetota bacterium]